MSTNATADFYLGLNELTRKAIETSCSNPTELGRAQERVHALNSMLTALGQRPERVVLTHALNEATVGLFLLASALYRSAFISLRLFLELSLASVHFSANRLELAEWLRGTGDVKWAAVSDEETGVLSKRYADAFFPELRESVSSYNGVARKVYRELSEFVHGNHNTWGIATNKIASNSDVHTLWLKQFEIASGVVIYALTLRFLKELSPGELSTISPILQDCLGTLEPLRNSLTGTKDAHNAG